MNKELTFTIYVCDKCGDGLPSEGADCFHCFLISEWERNGYGDDCEF